MKQKNINRLSEIEKAGDTKTKSRCLYFYKTGEDLPKPNPECKVVVYLPEKKTIPSQKLIS